MKILNIVSAKIWGGGEQYVYDVCKEMTNKNIENYVLVDTSNLMLQERFSDVTKVITANLYALHGFYDLSSILGLIDKYKIDIVNCHSGTMMPMCLLLKKLRNIKLVLFKHNAMRQKNDIYHKYLRKNVDHVICVSNLVYDLQLQGLNEEEIRKYHTVHNGISLDRFDKYPARKRELGKFVVGYAGRIVENKGVGIALRAIEILHSIYDNIVFKFAGSIEDGYYDEIKAYIEDNKMQSYVEYCGVETDMEKFYKSIDVLVAPSLAKEAFGLVLCEAMYCGVVVVTSNSGAQGEIIQNGRDGFILNKITPKDIAECIEKIYNKPDCMMTINRNAKEKIMNNFYIGRTVDRIIDICK